MKKHEHAGKSSRVFLNPGKVLGKIGIRAGDALLDAGCGEGQFSIAASGMVGSSGRIYALDVHGPSLAKLKAELKSKGIINVIQVLADFTKKTDFRKDYFDIVLMVNVLHGFFMNGEADRVMKEVSRILKKGGRFVVVEFMKTAFFGPPADHRISPGQIRKLAKNFREVSLQNVGLLSYMMVFGK